MLDGKYLRMDNSFTASYARMYPTKQMPRNIDFIVTENCNLCCSYCYQHEKTARVMPFHVAQKAVDTLFMADSENSGTINQNIAPALVLNFIGGEPFLEIDLIRKIVDYFLQRAIELNHRWQTHYMISMSTNGTLYFDDRVQRFLAEHLGRTSIGVTIDGNRQLHDACRIYPDGKGSYAEASAAFRDIMDKHGHTGTKLTIAPGNLPYLACAVKDMRENFGIHTLYGNCVYEDVWDEQLASEYYIQLKRIAEWMVCEEQYKYFRFSRFDSKWYGPLDPREDNNWCGGAGMMLAFGVDGTIYPCQRYAPHCVGAKAKPFPVGHVEHGIEVTEEEKTTAQTLRTVTRRSQSSDECFDCPVASGCGWCSAYNYEVYGTVNKRATFICPMHRAEALANVYYWNKLARALGSADRMPMRLDRATALEIVPEAEFDRLVALAAQ